MTKGKSSVAGLVMMVGDRLFDYKRKRSTMVVAVLSVSVKPSQCSATAKASSHSRPLIGPLLRTFVQS